jgi:hypothetical protein
MADVRIFWVVAALTALLTRSEVQYACMLDV